MRGLYRCRTGVIDMIDPLSEKKLQRFMFLNALYEKTGGNEHARLSMLELGAELSFSREQSELIVQFLVGEHLVRYAAMGGFIAITHHGVAQVEHALSSPDEPTEYFPPVINILNVGSITGSQVQQAGHSSSLVATVSSTEAEDLRKLVALLREQLAQLGEGPQMADLRAQIGTLDAQLQSQTPNRTIVRESLRSVRSILEGMAGGLIASGLLTQIQAWLAKL